MQRISSHTVDASASRNDPAHLLNATSAQLELTELMTHQVMDILDQPARDYGITHAGNAPVSDLVHIAPAQRRRVLFLIGEVESRCATVHDIARRQFDAAHLVEPSNKPSRELEDIITNWQDAHAKWRGRLDIGDENDNPESKAEDLAAEALLNCQCRTHADVQRKLSLFASINHLGSLVGSYPETFLPTVIIADGGAA
ncbi:hypothetical protein [uncultured Agrobacterium sp.]|uniref:hypothetical protein n=1 Tax=uncultured Agrobacterium sp. TaxID=157277 RepID=UPI00258BFC13|nr:hypothetical protein [uncultured Agrobacterium sp.]